MKSPRRCLWPRTDPLMLAYHDEEWGVPVHDDRKLFEYLILDAAQAGLSWSTVLRKREGYRTAFAGFDPVKVARFRPERVEKLMSDERIIRNRRKIESSIVNARMFLSVSKEFGSFDAYVWSFVGGKPIHNRWRTQDEIPVTNPQGQAMSKDMGKRGFRFVGPVICYAFMQAAGLVNDHLVSCYRYRAISSGR